MNTRQLTLYKVKAEGWSTPEYSAADSQTAAIENIAPAYSDFTPSKCSVEYVGEVYVNNYPDDREAQLLGEISKLRQQNDKLNKAIDCAFDTVAILSRHVYFRDQMWRKLDGRSDTDRAEVENTFLTMRLMEVADTVRGHVGSSWSGCTDEKYVTEQVREFNDIWEDYGKWCYEQR